MATDTPIPDFQKINPHIRLLAPGAPDWASWRETRGKAGQERKPLAIAIPQDAQQVSDIVRWSKNSDVDITVRAGGNDFYGRNVTDGGLIIDMREIKFITVAADKKTATIGGGVITKDLTITLDKQGLLVPGGNTWSVGYVGWAIFGGYGPLTGPYGLGFEGIVGAEIVNANGDIVQADEEILEGLRGLGGNLGIVTSLTVKVYPATKILSGMIMFDAAPENVKAVIAAEAGVDFPDCLTLHHFILKQQSRVLGLMFTWGNDHHDQGESFAANLIAKMPPVLMNTIAPKTVVQFYEELPVQCLPWGGQRSFYVADMTPELVDILMNALPGMPEDAIMAWSIPINIKSTVPPNLLGVESHIFLSFSDMVAEERLLAAARDWSDALYKKLRLSGITALMEASYPPLTMPKDRTTEQLLGDKWNRAKELKVKYDPNKVFRHAVPRM